MPVMAWIVIGGIGVAAICLALLEGRRRARERDEKSRMKPEDRAVRQRERKAFRQVFRRMR